MNKFLDNKLLYNKIWSSAKFENKEEDNAGYDLYAHKTEFDHIIMDAGEIRKVHTGIKLIIPKGYYGQIKERGSTGSKGLAVRSGVVDCNYRGEIIVVLNNTSNSTIKHDINKAIAQIIIKKYETFEIDEVSDDVYKMFETERGENAFGSTDKQ